ncbi:hypothetical protein HKX48_004251 [Thoreauomyces humboldtii]|nr:hypothetical protein HKX48_004251 [Thoreauomyces humboldtii]
MPKVQKERNRLHAKPTPRLGKGPAVPIDPALLAPPKPESLMDFSFSTPLALATVPAASPPVAKPIAPSPKLASVPVKSLVVPPAGSASIPEEDPLEKATRLGKKDKRQQRHDRWMEKLGGLYTAKTKKPKKVEGSLNLEALKDILSSVSGEEPEKAHDVLPVSASAPKGKGDKAGKGKRKEKGKGLGPQVPVSQKARRKAGVSEIIRLQKVLQHPTFKSNPLQTIRQHLENSMAQQNKAA